MSRCTVLYPTSLCKTKPVLIGIRTEKKVNSGKCIFFTETMSVKRVHVLNRMLETLIRKPIHSSPGLWSTTGCAAWNSNRIVGEQKWVDLLATEQVIDLQLAFLLCLVKASVWESAQPLLRADAEQQDQAGPQQVGGPLIDLRANSWEILLSPAHRSGYCVRCSAVPVPKKGNQSTFNSIVFLLMWCQCQSFCFFSLSVELSSLFSPFVSFSLFFLRDQLKSNRKHCSALVWATPINICNLSFSLFSFSPFLRSRVFIHLREHILCIPDFQTPCLSTIAFFPPVTASLCSHFSYYHDFYLFVLNKMAFELHSDNCFFYTVAYLESFGAQWHDTFHPFTSNTHIRRFLQRQLTSREDHATLLADYNCSLIIYGENQP